MSAPTGMETQATSILSSPSIQGDRMAYNNGQQMGISQMGFQSGYN